MGNKLLLTLLGLIVLVGVGCKRQASDQVAVDQVVQETMTPDKDAEQTPEATAGATGEQGRTFRLEEVAEHNLEDDCWLAIDGRVYDVTTFIANHPGGQAILQGCGTDATELYETRPMGSGTPHSPQARELLKGFYIGDLE